MFTGKTLEISEIIDRSYKLEVKGKVFFYFEDLTGFYLYRYIFPKRGLRFMAKYGKLSTLINDCQVIGGI